MQQLKEHWKRQVKTLMADKKPKKLTQKEWKEVEVDMSYRMLKHSIHSELHKKGMYAYKLATLSSNLKKGKVVKTYGLCHYLKSDVMSYFLSTYWPESSGSRVYPILDKKNKSVPNPNVQFRIADKWSDSQLKLRIAYAKFLLANLSGYFKALENVLNQYPTTNQK